MNASVNKNIVKIENVNNIPIVTLNKDCFIPTDPFTYGSLSQTNVMSLTVDGPVSSMRDTFDVLKYQYDMDMKHVQETTDFKTKRKAQLKRDIKAVKRRKDPGDMELLSYLEKEFRSI